MLLKSLEINSLLGGSSAKPSEERISQSTVSDSDIAVIGMSGQIADAENLDAFWGNLVAGKCSVRSLPESRRKDVDDYLDLHHALSDNLDQQYLDEAYLNEVDKFDYRFFGISRQEANLMDPDQRLFLETAWAAIEDAGYGGALIEGSRTGVFVGLSNDFGEDYRKIINTFAPDAPEISIVGNIKSVIASRIAYHLDLKGPSLIVDTACSSALVALHLACKSIRDGESDMALAGTVKTHLIPVFENASRGVGLKDIHDTFAQDYRTKTFDESSDGMSIGEGVVVFMLKRLSAALADNDNIHCVVKGSAINQDGKTIGLTAPSNNAQAEAITEAHRDAQVSPQAISYIEAHGTGTKLGDPVEISGINRAFRKNTNRKQFCGIGSVKTNVGHLDNAAGLVSFAKVALAMKHRILPASLNFSIPNNKISFHDSPVYVVDRTQNWGADSDECVYAGINSFGLSGTNCHVVVKSQPRMLSEVVVDNMQLAEPDPADLMLPLSAKTPESLLELARRYKHHIESKRFTTVDLVDMCSTAFYGRWHYDQRAVLLFRDSIELLAALEQFLKHGGVDAIVDGIGVRSGNHRELDGTESSSAIMEQAQVYCAGDEPDWAGLFGRSEYKKVSLPTYPFARDRCWVELSEAGNELYQSSGAARRFEHPLMQRLLAESHGLKLFGSTLSPETHWELGEHVVRGKYVLPGTCYVEIMLQAIANLRSSDAQPVVFNSVQFLSPFVVNQLTARKELHTKVISNGSLINIEILSLADDGQWVVHAAAVIQENDQQSLPLQVSKKATEINADKYHQASSRKLLDLQELLPRAVQYTKEDDAERGLEISERWVGSFKRGFSNQNLNQFLFHFELPKKYTTESQLYQFHPALFDSVINAANHLIGDGSLYLPLAYQDLKISGSLPDTVFVSLRLLNERNSEVVQFSIDIFDRFGVTCASVEKYSVKKVANGQLLDDRNGKPAIFTSDVITHPDGQLWLDADSAVKGQKLVYIHNNGLGDLVDMQNLKDCGYSLQALPLERLIAEANHENFKDLFADCSVIAISARHFDAVRGSDKHQITQMYSALQVLINLQVAADRFLLVLTSTAYAGKLGISPVQSAIAVMTQVAAEENPDMRIIALDSDELTSGYVPRTIACQQAGLAWETQFIVRDGVLMQHIQTVGGKTKEAQIRLVEDGVYLITGGSGALGLELAARLGSLADQQEINITIALAGRRDLMGENASEQPYELEDNNGKSDGARQRIDAIKSKFADVRYVQMSLTDIDEISATLTYFRANHGEIRGIFHAAGSAGDGFMRMKDPEMLESVLSPKVDGFGLLSLLTHSDPLDYFVAYSSINSIVVEAGQADYAAANRYMDMAMFNRRQQGKPGLSVRWPAWSEVGMAVEYDAVDDKGFFKPISTQSAVDALFYSLNQQTELPPVVTLANLSDGASMQVAENSKMRISDALRSLLDANLSVENKMSRVNSTGFQHSSANGVVLTGSDSIDETTQQVGDIWGQVLLEDQLDTEESFNDLGGNSILTAQLYKEFNALWPGVLDMADLFTHTTINAQAALVKKVLGLAPTVESENTPGELTIETESDTDEMILNMLINGEMSVEEAQAIL